MWAKERASLLSLPERRLAPKELQPTIARKTPWIRFDLNSYSVPPEAVGKSLIVTADEERVEIMAEGKLIASHPRSWNGGKFIEDPAHREALLAHSHFGRTNQFRDTIVLDFPAADKILKHLFSAGYDVATVVRHLYKLRYHYGDDLFGKAVARAVADERYTVESLRHILQTMEIQKGKAPSVAVKLPDDPKIKDLDIKKRDLSTYDKL
jgi:hypothetical protein